MAYTAVVILNNAFLTSFCFDATHDRAAAYKRACEIWQDGSALSRHCAQAAGMEREEGRVCAIFPGYHEAYTPFGG